MAVQGPDLGDEDLLSIANLRILFFAEYFQHLLRKFRPCTSDAACSCSIRMRFSVSEWRLGIPWVKANGLLHTRDYFLYGPGHQLAVSERDHPRY